VAQVFNSLSELIQSIETECGTETFNACLNDSDYFSAKNSQKYKQYLPISETLQVSYDNAIASYDSAGEYPTDSAGPYVNIQAITPRGEGWVSGLDDHKGMAQRIVGIRVQ